MDRDITELSELLTGEKVCLRTLVQGDLEFLYLWENDRSVWQYGDCGFFESEGVADDLIGDAAVTAGACSSRSTERFSREQLRRFIENQQYDISETGQIRFVICRRDTDCIERDGGAVGFIDIFDLDPVELSADVGILICDPVNRRRGYGCEAVVLASEYAHRIVGLHELRCTVAADNTASMALFTAAGFVTAAESTPANTDPVAHPDLKGEIIMFKSLYSPEHP